MGQLNELQIKAAEPRDKEYLLADGEGLYLRVRPTGKAWVYRYKEAGKEAKLSLGRYPAMSLVAARKTARAEVEKRAGGVDPREARREEEERDRVARLNTFELMARAWHSQAQKDRQWSSNFAEKVMRHLELHVFPWIGSLTMEAIKPTSLCAACIASGIAATWRQPSASGRPSNTCSSTPSMWARWSPPGSS